MCTLTLTGHLANASTAVSSMIFISTSGGLHDLQKPRALSFTLRLTCIAIGVKVNVCSM